MRITPEQVKRHVDAHIDDRLDDLKATPDQRQKIHGQVDALYPDAVKLYRDHQATRAEAIQILAPDVVDAPKLHALVDARIDAFRAFAHKAVDAVIAVHDVFTPAQRAQIVARAKACE
jgi:periplasmic protein CpxP/Spy